MKIQIYINKHLLLQKESPFIAQSFSNKKKTSASSQIRSKKYP